MALEEEAAPLVLGPVIVARPCSSAPVRRSPRSGSGDAEFVALYLPIGDTPGCEGEALVVDGVLPPGAVGARERLALLAPRRFLLAAPPPGSAPERVPHSVALRVLQVYLDGLLTLERGALCDRQGELAAGAIRSLLAAALLPERSGRGLASRRRESLLERVVVHVDANPHAALSTDSLCEALACSRSALYRATEGAGGVAQLIQRRRMRAVLERLRDPNEQRPIIEIAAAHGFPDAAQFSRRFKALFGATPGEMRRGGTRMASPRLHRESVSMQPPPRRPLRPRPCR